MFYIAYIVNTLLMPLILCKVARKHIYWSIPLAICLDLILQWQNFAYYESGMIMVFITGIQVIIIFAISFFLKKTTIK